MSGEDVLAEDSVQTGVKPVGKRRLFEVANAVELHRDPVAGFGHVLGDLGVRGIDVIEQRRGKERGKLNGEENSSQKRPCRHEIRRRPDRANVRILSVRQQLNL